MSDGKPFIAGIIDSRHCRVRVLMSHNTIAEPFANVEDLGESITARRRSNPGLLEDRRCKMDDGILTEAHRSRARFLLLLLWLSNDRIVGPKG